MLQYAVSEIKDVRGYLASFIKKVYVLICIVSAQTYYSRAANWL